MPVISALSACRSNQLGRLLVVPLGLALLVSGNRARGFSASDANTLASAFTSAFYTQDGTNGYIKDTESGGIAYFWGQAEMIECVIDAYEWTGDPAYEPMITNLLNGFITHNGSDWAWNIYNDDIFWAVLAFARGGQDTGHPEYCAIAKSNFDACYARAWDSQLGGGLYWTSDNWTKNACVNGPGAIAAFLLYQIYGDAGYLNKANSIYNWERAVLFDSSSGAISDAIGTNGVVNHWASTYNQGTFIGAAHFLGRTHDATLAANYTMTRMTTGGILPEYGIAGNNSGFNAIFLRWMTRFMKDRNLQSTYEPWLQLNATAAWNRRRADNLSWCQWLHGSPAATSFHAWDCISSFEALLAAEPTETDSPSSVPKHPIGNWPLDDMSGTIATDTSGNGNNGSMNGAGWNSEGRFNGCLSFNGTSSSVQINNPVANDFSIVFWVKTTQTAGIGQWYHGAGLVDGDVPFTRNDFGTALIGGKFAFGVGNPDTTILSTAAINDGAWHQCVATRQQSTGMMKVYVDGNLRGTGTGTRNSLNASGHLLFGAIASGGGHFDGSLDEVRIFIRTLSSAEVAALYSSSAIAPSAAPANLNATAGNGQVHLNWSEAPAATRYNVKRSLINGGPYVTIANVSTAGYTDTEANNNQTCYYVVSAVNAAGESTNSVQASASPSPLKVWLKADAVTGLTSGSKVAAWPDLTGNGYDAIQTLSANQPSFVSNAINGSPAIRFDSAISSYLWLYRPVQDDFTMIFVFQSSQGIGNGTSFWDGAGLVNGEQSGAVSDFGLSLNAQGQILAGTGNPDRTLRSAPGFNDGQPHVVTFKRTRSNGIIFLYVDGAPVAATSGGTQSLTAPNILVLGAQGVLNNFLSGDIAELRIYDAPLSDPERSGIERALKCEYGLSGGAVPSAPTGLTCTAGNRQVALNWTLVPGATDYDLWRSTNNGATYELVASTLTTSSYVDTHAVNGQMNYYKIAAANGCGAGTPSAPIGVFLPLPELSMNLNANGLTLTWPDWASDWTLYSATNLTPPIAWTLIPNNVSSNGGLFSVTLPLDSEVRFFRLAAP